MTFKQYPEYKVVTEAWLGKVPINWSVFGAKRVFFERNIKAQDVDEQLTASQKYGVIPQKLFTELEGVKVMQVLTGREILKKAEPGDFVISMRSFQGGLEYCEYSGAVSSAYVPLYPAVEIENGFFKHLFKSAVFISALQLTSNLVRDGQALRYANFSLLSLPLPPIDEQTQIARFLDHEVGKIDALIAEQEKLISLLKEKRQAVISHAVTKGLNPDAPMKDSGVEWLGQVPEHWDVARMRFLCSITTGSRDTQDAREDGDYPFFVRSDTIERIDTYSFNGEGVFTSGDGAGVGKIFHHFTGKCEIHQRVYLFHEFKRISGSFFYNYLRTNLEPVVLSQSAKSTVDSLRMPMLQNFWMTCPPESEQEKICSFINKVESETADLLNESEKTVSLLKERRSALISAAVTGKIDVRGWQPPAAQ